MIKKIPVVLSLGAFLLLSPLPRAHAATPAKTPAPANPGDGTLLGTLEGAISFCTKGNPNALPSYKQVDRFLTETQGAKAIAQIRTTDSYEDAYEQVVKLLKGLTAKEAAAACSGH